VESVARTHVAEIMFIMLTNANVNRNDRQARTEEYLRGVRTVVGALAGSALHKDRSPVCGSPRTVIRQILSARRNCDDREKRKSFSPHVNAIF